MGGSYKAVHKFGEGLVEMYIIWQALVRLRNSAAKIELETFKLEADDFLDRSSTT